MCFYAPVSDRQFLELNQFYSQDIRILRSLTDRLIIATRWSEVPWDADAYFIWWWTRAFVPMSKALPRRKPCFVTGTFDLENPMPGMGYATRPRHQRALIAFALRYATANIFVSELEYRAVPKALATHNPMYAPHVIDCEMHRYASGPRDHFLFSIGWLNGAAVARKGIDLAIVAHAALLERHPSLELRIAGTPGDAAGPMRDLAQRHGSLDRVKFLGRIDDAEKVRLLQRCAAYLQPSVFEGFGVAAAEAMACGAPVVAYERAGALPEVLGPDAFFFSERTPTAVAEAIERAMAGAGTPRLEQAAANVCHRFTLERRKQTIVRAIEAATP